MTLKCAALAERRSDCSVTGEEVVIPPRWEISIAETDNYNWLTLGSNEGISLSLLAPRSFASPSGFVSSFL